MLQASYYTDNFIKYANSSTAEVSIALPMAAIALHTLYHPARVPCIVRVMDRVSVLIRASKILQIPPLPANHVKLLSPPYHPRRL